VSGGVTDKRVTEEQAEWLLRRAARGEVQAISFNLGSDGYPPPEDGWALLTDGRSVWIAPDGKERPA
jgi:hypothetical protein